MNISRSFSTVIAGLLALISFCSCNKEFRSDNFTAYFGGEVTNPTNPYVLLFKDGVFVDSLKIDRDNRFFKKFDSLAPGLYTFRHEPEYQYVYFDKNDSLMVSIDSKAFDASIVFSGRGDEKNNFLIELYLRNDNNRNNMFTVFDYDFPKFNKIIDSIHQVNKRFYDSKKLAINWSEEFEVFAKAALEMPYYSHKEIYPVIHQVRTGNDVIEKLPKDYYDYRKKIDFNNDELAGFSPFVNYLTLMLNNMAVINYHNHFTEADLALKTNTNKMDIADTLISNEKIKNTILNNIAFNYLLEDQNIVNNQKFLEAYKKYSTDNSQRNEITKIGNAIALLKPGNLLPPVQLIDTQGKVFISDQALQKKTVLFFWTENATTHLVEAHKKALAFHKKYPQYDFVAVCVDPNQQKWKNRLAKYNLEGITEYRCVDFEDMRIKWAITKIHRTIILAEDSTIKNAFTNLFNNDFEDQLAAEEPQIDAH